MNNQKRKEWSNGENVLMQDWIRVNENVPLTWCSVNPDIQHLFPDASLSSLYHKWRRTRIAMSLPSIPGGKVYANTNHKGMQKQQAKRPQFNIFAAINDAVDAFIAEHYDFPDVDNMR